MSRDTDEPPRHVVALRKRIENIAGGDQARANRIIRMATTVASDSCCHPRRSRGAPR
jgi:hypothetical protein